MTDPYTLTRFVFDSDNFVDVFSDGSMSIHTHRDSRYGKPVVTGSPTALILNAAMECIEDLREQRPSTRDPNKVDEVDEADEAPEVVPSSGWSITVADLLGALNTVDLQAEVMVSTVDDDDETEIQSCIVDTYYPPALGLNQPGLLILRGGTVVTGEYALRRRELADEVAGTSKTWSETEFFGVKKKAWVNR